MINVEQGRYHLVLDDGALDWGRFQQLTVRARTALADECLDEAAGLLADALALWQGPPLGDIGERMEFDRRRLAGARLTAVEELAGIEATRGRPQRVHDLLAGELAMAPGRERCATLLIQALVTLGRREEAGEVFHLTRRYLAEELGLDPSGPLVAAYRQALEGGPAATVVTTASTSVVLGWSGLPRRDRHFTGRDAEQNRLRATLANPDAAPICVVSGMAGVGKTALAVRTAAGLAEHYPDGCVFVDLHGHSPGRAPLDPVDVLDRLLRGLGVPGAAIPEGAEERAALFRDRVAGRRLLLLLDNVRDFAQVEPLIPGLAGCGVIITSRRRLVALDDAEQLVLPILPAPDAAALFTAVVGKDRMAGEPNAEVLIRRIVDRCGSLPLAVRIAAARHRVRDRRTLADLDADLTDAHTVLDELDDGERSVAASIAVSLTDLAGPLQRAFALLAVHPGDDLALPAAAALWGEPAAAATRLLDALCERHLLTEHSPRRYRLHDLVAVYARQHALATRPPAERTAALRRVVDYYLQAADAADQLVTPHRYRVALALVNQATVLPTLDGYDDALAWLGSELGNLTEACQAAGANGLDEPCWQLAYTLRGYFFLTKYWQPWLATHTAALAAAGRRGDLRAEAMTANNLGVAHLEQGKLDIAAGYYERALHLFERAGDVHGVTNTRVNQAWVLFAQRRYREFLDICQPVLAFYRHSGSDRNTAITLRGVGLAEVELGQYPEAIAHLQEALDLSRRLDLRLDTTMALNGLGEAYQRAGCPEQAEAAFTQALESCQLSGSAFERARAYHRLGDLAYAAGRFDLARTRWAHAAREYQQVGAPQADEVRTKLTHLPG